MLVSSNALMRGYLLNADPGAGGGGAGGDPPKPLTEADVEAMVGRTVNAAVTSHMKRGMGPAIAEALKTVDWKSTLAPIVTELAPKPAEPAPGGGNEPKKPDPEIAALRAQLDEVKASAARSEAARVEIETRSRDQGALASLKSALAPHVKPELLDMVARDLFTGQKRVTFDESGRPLITVKKAPYGGAPEEDVQMTLEDGAAHFAKTEGKHVANPPAVPGNTGSRGPQGGPRTGAGRDANGMPVYSGEATSDAERIQRSQEQAAALGAKYPHLTRSNT